jgi:hypothetical protein
MPQMMQTSKGELNESGLKYPNSSCLSRIVRDLSN